MLLSALSYIGKTLFMSFQVVKLLYSQCVNLRIVKAHPDTAHLGGHKCWFIFVEERLGTHFVPESILALVTHTMSKKRAEA